MIASTLAFLVAWGPVFMPLILWLFDKFGTSEDAKQDFIKKVQALKGDGAIAIEQRDQFRQQEQEFKDDAERARQESTSGAKPNP